MISSVGQQMMEDELGLCTKLNNMKMAVGQITAMAFSPFLPKLMPYFDRPRQN